VRRTDSGREARSARVHRSRYLARLRVTSRAQKPARDGTAIGGPPRSVDGRRQNHIAVRPGTNLSCSRRAPASRSSGQGVQRVRDDVLLAPGQELHGEDGRGHGQADAVREDERPLALHHPQASQRAKPAAVIRYMRFEIAPVSRVLMMRQGLGRESCRGAQGREVADDGERGLGCAPG